MAGRGFEISIKNVNSVSRATLAEWLMPTLSWRVTKKKKKWIIPTEHTKLNVVLSYEFHIISFYHLRNCEINEDLHLKKNNLHLPNDRTRLQIFIIFPTYSFVKKQQQKKVNVSHY